MDGGAAVSKRAYEYADMSAVALVLLPYFDVCKRGTRPGTQPSTNGETNISDSVEGGINNIMSQQYALTEGGSSQQATVGTGSET